MNKELIVLNSKDRKLILKDLESLYGVTELPEGIYFCINKKEKVYLTTREAFELSQEDLRVNTFGMYFGTIMKDGFRPSLEGLDMLKSAITKNVLEINEAQFEEWILGSDLEVENKDDDNTYLVIKFGEDFVGIGKLKGNTILNYLPKSRKLQKVIL